MYKRKSRFNRLKCEGFTLVELILYVALVGIFVTSAISFAWDIVYGREKAYQQQVVSQNAKIAMARISYEIRNASDIVSVSDYELVLEKDGAQTTINLSDTRIQIAPSGLGPYYLTSNQVVVDNTNPIFRDLTGSSNNTKNIEVTLTLNQARDVDNVSLVASTTIKESVELNSQFNQSRGLLINLTGADLIDGTLVQGITLENTSSSDLVIDKMYISWSGIPMTENVVEVQIDAGEIEWTGTELSDTEIDLTDYTLISGGGAVSLDYIEFDSDMSGATLYFEMILLDGSSSVAELTLPASGTPTPTPTSTPTPTPTPEIASCSDYCISISYSNGTCRRNSGQCKKNGEVDEAGGDVWCTGSDGICCCNP